MAAKMRAINHGASINIALRSTDIIDEAALLADRIPQRRKAKHAERLLDLIDSLENDWRCG